MFGTATQIAIDVSWPASLAVVAGTGKIYLWSKTQNTVTGETMATASKSCGTTIPEITTSAIAGGMKILPEIPETAWDSAMMPTFQGTATNTNGMLNIDPGVVLIGFSMPDPMGAFPDAADIMALDADGDGSPGLTAVPRMGDGFQAPPTSIALTTLTDKLYLATRAIVKLQAAVTGCPDTYSGTAMVSNFDNHVIGCHVVGGADCTPDESGFVDDNTPIFTIVNATFMTKVVPVEATCADVRAALPKL